MRTSLLRSSALVVALASGLSCGGSDGDGGLGNINCAASVIAFPANVTSTFPNSQCTANGVQARFLQFTSSGGEARFDVEADNGAFTPDIAVIKEGATEFVTFAGDAGSVFGTWLLPAGTYQLRVLASAGTAGPFSVSGVSSTTGCLPHALLALASATYNGRIETAGNTSTGDCTFPDRNYDTYLVLSSKPCTITMRGSLDAALSASNFLTHAVISSDDNSGGGASGKDARITLPSCRVGASPIEITATVSDAAAGTSGAYTLEVQISGGQSLRR